VPSFLDQFYATKRDLEDALPRVERAIGIDYILAGMFPKPEVIRYGSWFMLPRFGLPAAGEHLLEPQYLVVPKGAGVVPEVIPQRRGGILYAVDSRHTPASMIFHPGGEYGETTIISGELGTNGGDSVSREILRVFREQFFKGFEKIHAYHVGPEAAGRLNLGWRLTPGIKWSREVDLKRPSPSASAKGNGRCPNS